MDRVIAEYKGQLEDRKKQLRELLVQYDKDLTINIINRFKECRQIAENLAKAKFDTGLTQGYFTETQRAWYVEEYTNGDMIDIIRPLEAFCKILGRDLSKLREVIADHCDYWGQTTRI